MSQKTDLLIHELIVVAFDMCSSSNIVEDLTLTGNIHRYRDFLTTLKRWLRDQAKQNRFIIYKFTGDGWILLFMSDADGGALLSFLHSLCDLVKRELKNEIMPYLESPPTVTGVAIGIEKGPLVKMIMLQQVEFVGRALNVACRLQNAVKDKGGPPAYKALVSNQVYNTYLRDKNSFKAWRAERVLRNIRGGDRYKCWKIDFMRREARG